MSHLAYGHGRIGVPSTGRAPEYLENLKNEFESMTHDINLYKMQRDDFERKLTSQLNELSNIQQTLFDLEKSHIKIKQQYEDEIVRLRRQIDSMSGNATPGRELSSPLGNAFRPSSPVQSTSGPSLGRPPLPSSSSSSSTPSTPGSLTEKISQEKRLSTFTAGGTPINTSGGGNGGSGGNTPGGSGKRARQNSNEGPTFYQGQPGGGAFPALNPLASVGEPTNKHLKTEKKNEGLEFPPLPAMHSKDPNNNNNNNNNNGRGNSSSEGGNKEDMMIEKKPAGPEETEEGKEKNGTDWIVGYNPGVQTNLNIDLMHNLNHSSVVCCVKFSANGKYLATGCNKSAQIYDVETGKKVHTFSDDAAKDGDLYIRSVCFSPDGEHLATGAEDKTVKVWDIAHKRVLHTFTGHELDIYSLDFSQDGRFIVSGSGDKKAKIWDIEKGKCAFTLGNDEVGPKDGVTSVAISPDGRLVAAGSLDRIVRLWDAQTGYFLERYEGHADSVYSVAFSIDGKSLASGSLDKTLKLWDLSGARTRSRCRSTFNGHKDFVLSVAFSPDGNWLISGSKDRSVQFWDPRSAVTHMMLQGHKNSVISVALSPTGGVFATGSGDYRARLWKYES